MFYNFGNDELSKISFFNVCKEMYFYFMYYVFLREGYSLLREGYENLGEEYRRYWVFIYGGRVLIYRWGF